MRKLPESDGVSSDVYARHRLLSCSQKDGESLEEYMNTLEKLTKGCKFKAVSAAKNRNDYIRDVFISGISSDSIRECLLKRRILTFEDAFAQAKSLEQAQSLIESQFSFHTSTNSTSEDNLVKIQEDEDYGSALENDSFEEEDNKPDVSVDSCELEPVNESLDGTLDQSDAEVNPEEIVKEENAFYDVEIEFNPLDTSGTEENSCEQSDTQEKEHSDQYFDFEGTNVNFESSKDFQQEEIVFAAPNQLDNVGEDLINQLEDLIDNSKKGKVNKPFKCNICRASFSRKTSLKLHKIKHKDGSYNPSLSRLENYDQENLVCSFCSESFPNLNDLLSHSLFHSDGEQFPCVYCSKMFTSDYSLKRHFASHTDPKKHLCAFCLRGFRRRYDLNRHMKIHNVTKIPTSKSVRDKNPLKHHSKAIEKEYTCSTCSKTFINIYQLTSHLATHTVEKHFTCHLCSESFYNEYTLSKHIELHNYEERDFTCALCSKKFCDEFNLTLHLRLHSEDEQFTCTVCFESFDRRKDLKLHSRLHNGEKELKCTVCNKKFADKRGLNRHKQSHARGKQFRCEVCYKSFSDKYNLARHHRVHDVTDEKGQTCTICSRRFGDKHGLTRHMRTHTGEKPFKCDICDKAYAEKSKLKKHINTHHG